MLMGIVASGVMPVSEVAGKPLTAAASVVVLGSGGLYAFLSSEPASGALIHNTEFKFHLVFKFSDRGM